MFFVSFLTAEAEKDSESGEENGMNGDEDMDTGTTVEDTPSVISGLEALSTSASLAEQAPLQVKLADLGNACWCVKRFSLCVSLNIRYAPPKFF